MYSSYGGRGISVCEQWRADPMSFVQWALANGYAPGLTIDRKDNDGNYSPENCRWATALDQGKNKSNNRFITHDGRAQTISDWERETGISGAIIQVRLDRCGWSVERALTERPKPRKQIFYQGGVGRTMREWAAAAGVSHSAACRRAKHGHDMMAPPTPVEMRGQGLERVAA
jgi:hypothetical protein